jgi:hypothetical protein
MRCSCDADKGDADKGDAMERNAKREVEESNPESNKEKPE